MLVSSSASGPVVVPPISGNVAGRRSAVDPEITSVALAGVLYHYLVKVSFTSRTRTGNTLMFSQLLYPLSYSNGVVSRIRTDISCFQLLYQSAMTTLSDFRTTDTQ